MVEAMQPAVPRDVANVTIAMLARSLKQYTNHSCMEDGEPLQDATVDALLAVCTVDGAW